jgi:6-phosphogluconolactonase
MNNAPAAESLLLVGSYAETEQPGIYLFRYDKSDHQLHAAGAINGIVNPSFVAAHPRGPWLYAVSESSPGAVWAIAMQDDSPGGTLINQQPSGGDAPCHIAIDASGSWLLVANYSSGTVGVLPIQRNGALGEMTDLIQHHGSGVNPERQDGPHAHSATFTPDQRFVIVADLGIDQLLVYAFDAAAGKLHARQQIDTEPGAGPRHLAFDPSGRFVYVANELSSSVGVYGYHAEQGRLDLRQTIATIPASAGKNLAAAIRVAASGQQVYVSNRGHNSIAVFDADDDGRLTYSAILPCGGNWPRDFTIAPGGDALLIANERSDGISVLPLGGNAQPIQTDLALSRPSSLCFYPAHSAARR